MVTIGVAIPCYNGHLDVLKRLLDSIEKQTRRPDSVIVCCSSTSSIPYSIDMYTFPLKIITTENKQNAAQNRNAAMEILDTDIISFIDADDIMHPQRLEIIEKAFKENDIVLFLHSFLFSYNHEFEEYDITSVNFDIGKLTIAPCGFGAKHVINPKLNIHNGQPSITRNVAKAIKYNTESHNTWREDSMFCAEIITKYPTLTGYSNVELSKYEASSSYKS